MDALSPTPSFTQPKLAHCASDLLWCLKTQSMAVSGIWDSVSFADMKSNEGGSDIKGGRLAVDKLSLACAELAKCGDLQETWGTLTLAKLAEQLEKSGSMSREGVSIGELCKELQGVLDELTSKEVKDLTDGFGGLGMDDELEAMLAGALEEIEDSGVIELPAVPKEKSPEDRWKELRIGLTKLNMSAIKPIMSQSLSPGVEALSLLQIIAMIDSPSMDEWFSSLLAAGQEDPMMKMLGQVFSSAKKVRPYVQGEGASWWRALNTCLWEILNEEQFPGLQEAYRQMVEDPEKAVLSFPEKIGQAMEAAMRVTVNPSYRLTARDFPLVLGLRAQVAFQNEWMRISMMQMQTEATRLISSGVTLDASLLQSLQQEALDVASSLESDFADGPLVRAIEAGMVDAPAGGSVPIPEELPKILMGKLDSSMVKIDPAGNNKAEVVAVTGLKKILKNWTLKGELKFGDRLKVWTQILLVAFHYNETFYLPGRPPWLILCAGDEEDFKVIQSTLDGTSFRQWLETYTAALEANLKDK